MINKTLALTLLGLIAFSGAPASAQPASDQARIKVSYEGRLPTPGRDGGTCGAAAGRPRNVAGTPASSSLPPK